jgi:hypothetical protein
VNDVDPERVVPLGPAEFVAAMRDLKAAAHVGFRTLEKRAEAVGDVLPKSTLVAVLSRDTLPREEVVAAFVRACGLGEDAVERWLAVRRQITGGEPPHGSGLPVELPPAPLPEPVAPVAVAESQPAAVGWLADLVPPAIRQGSRPLRVVSALLLGLVGVITVAAVVGSVRDWVSQPDPTSGASGVPDGREWTVVREGRLSLRDAQSVDFETMRVGAGVPGRDLELRGARLDAPADIALLRSVAEPEARRCLESSPQDWNAVLAGVNRLAPGRQACLVTDTGLVVLLTLETAPAPGNPVLVCRYVIWRRSL